MEGSRGTSRFLLILGVGLIAGGLVYVCWDHVPRWSRFIEQSLRLLLH